MTLEKLLSQMGTGTKHFTDRFTEYHGPVHEQQLYYAYEPPTSLHEQEADSKYNYGGGGGQKSNAAMSALTLLAFLFFLHILQQCIRDHMTDMSTPQIMIMTAGREGETILQKSDTQKLDKTGISERNSDDFIDKSKRTKEKNNKENTVDLIENNLMKINTAEPPKTRRKYRDAFRNVHISNLTNFERNAANEK